MSAFSLEESKASLLYLLYFTGYKLKCLRVSLSQTGIVWRQLCLSPGNLRSHLTIEMFHPEVERWHAQPQLLTTATCNWSATCGNIHCNHQAIIDLFCSLVTGRSLSYFYSSMSEMEVIDKKAISSKT